MVSVQRIENKQYLSFQARLQTQRQVPASFKGYEDGVEIIQSLPLPRNFTAAELAGMIQAMNHKLSQQTQPSSSQLKQEFKKVRAQHILVDSAEQAQQIKDNIESGQLNFEEAAAKFSSCPSGRDGGDLGYFDRGTMVKPFADAAFAADVNQIVGPIETKFGFHLIKTIDKV